LTSQPATGSHPYEPVLLSSARVNGKTAEHLTDRARTQRFFDLVLAGNGALVALEQDVPRMRRGEVRRAKQRTFTTGEAQAATVWAHLGGGFRGTRLVVRGRDFSVHGAALLLNRDAGLALAFTPAPPTLVATPLSRLHLVALWLYSSIDFVAGRDPVAEALQARLGGRLLRDFPVPGVCRRRPDGYHGAGLVSATGRPWNQEGLLSKIT
jgi:hypothetical protein